LQCPALADQARQALRAAVAGKDAQLDFGLPEPGALRRNADRAGHRELATAAQRVAVDRRDDRLAEVLEERHHALAEGRGTLGRERIEGDRWLMSAPATKALPAPVTITP
jgi:hypothetical protein